MKFVTIEPAETRVRMIDADNLFDLYEPLGLVRMAVDHGVVVPLHQLPGGAGVSIVVADFSLFEPKQHYFAIARHLYAGNAILYAFDESGETVDMRHEPMVVFLTVAGIERAIEADELDRPTLAVNDEIVWQWPEPSPYAREARKVKLVRPHIPIAVKLEVIARQLQVDRKLMAVLTVSALTMKNTDRLAYMIKAKFGDEKVHLDHDPSLVLRHYDVTTGKYTPDANDPRYLVYRTAAEHKVKTFLRNGAEFSDAAKRRRKIKQERKEKEPPRPNRWPPKGSRKIASRPFLKVVR